MARATVGLVCRGIAPPDPPPSVSTGNLKAILASQDLKKHINAHTLGWLLLECLDAIYSHQVMENSGHIES